MTAIILNSGLGKRMGELTVDKPKCLSRIYADETVLSRQLKQLRRVGIKNVIVTTGAFENTIREYCNNLKVPLEITFVNNARYAETNYIYSLSLIHNEFIDDVVLLHGDLVFDDAVLEFLLKEKSSSVVVSSTSKLPKKDFKAVVAEGKVKKIGVDFFENAVASQPLYKLKMKDWRKWFDMIIKFCVADKTDCYAEDAFNEISDYCDMKPCDINIMFCQEIDTVEDLTSVRKHFHQNQA